MPETKYCDKNCTDCPLINHPNSRMLSRLMNALYNAYGDGVMEIINQTCPNMSVCYDCRIDDFCHLEECKIIESPVVTSEMLASQIARCSSLLRDYQEIGSAGVFAVIMLNNGLDLARKAIECGTAEEIKQAYEELVGCK